jgi:hypothetical protein
MAGSADREYVREADRDAPADEATNSSINPVSPPAVTVFDESQPTNHARGSSTAPGLLDPATTYNDAMRSPVIGLGQNGVEAGQPAFGSAAPHTNDLVALKNGLLAEVNAGQYSGATLGHVQAILSDINTAISSANAAANGANVPGMEQALRASQLSIINAVNTDPALANPAPQNEPTEPEAKPSEDAETPAETAEPEETAEAGDATDATQVTDDLDAAIAEMEALIAANPEVFSGLTVDDAEEIVQQIQLELAQLNEGDAPLGTAQSDSIDITDIVTGDIDLASLAAQVHLNAQGQEAGNGDVHILPQTAAIPVNDVPATIGTGEAPMIVVDHGHSGTPEPVNHLHVIWE